jgi:hypothetical protein
MIREDQPCPQKDLEDHARQVFAGLAVAGRRGRALHQPRCSTTSPKQAFPRDTRRHLYIETAIGLGLSSRKTRPLAIVGPIGYGAYLAGNAVRNR